MEDKSTKLLEIFVDNSDVAEDFNDWIEAWRDDVEKLIRNTSDSRALNVFSVYVSDVGVLETILAVLSASYGGSAIWKIDGVLQEVAGKVASQNRDDLQSKLSEFVAEFNKNPRNKILIEWDLLIQSARFELQKEIKGEKVKRAIVSYIRGRISASNEEIYDAAVAVCGELARKCFAPGRDDCDYQISWSETADGNFLAEVREA
jgi:hypothetical protein